MGANINEPHIVYVHVMDVAVVVDVCTAFGLFVCESVQFEGFVWRGQERREESDS